MSDQESDKPVSPTQQEAPSRHSCEHGAADHEDLSRLSHSSLTGRRPSPEGIEAVKSHYRRHAMFGTIPLNDPSDRGKESK